MSDIHFILKSFGLSLFISFVIGATIGFALDFIFPPHPAYQLIASWLAMGIFAAFTGVIISLLVSLIMILKYKPDIKKLLIISSSGSFVFVLVFSIWLLV